MTRSAPKRKRPAKRAKSPRKPESTPARVTQDSEPRPLSPWAWSVLPMLLVAIGISTEPLRYLQAWNGPPAPGLADLKPLPTPPGDAPGLVMLLIDGLGATPSRRLTKLKALREEGADVTLTAVYPSKSRPAYVTMLTGLPPVLHGARNNRTPGGHGLDTFLARAKDAGLATACVGDRIDWFAELAEGGCQTAKTTRSDQNFIQAAADALASPAKVVVLHWLGVDWMGHEHGGASGQYGAAARDADALVGLVASQARGRVVAIVADHGHSAHGGHGGDERVVTEVPLVLKGPGVRVGVQVRGEAHQLASTLATLAGIAVPAASVGRPIWEALDPKLKAAKQDHADAIYARASKLTHPPAADAGPLVRLLAALALIIALLFRRIPWAVVGALTPLCAVVLLIGRGDPLTLSAVDLAPRFISRLLGYSGPAAIMGAVVLVRSAYARPVGDRARDASIKALAYAAGAAGPWLAAAAWAGFRPYPELPTAVAGFLPVALAIPAVLGLFSAAICIPIAAWGDG